MQQKQVFNWLSTFLVKKILLSYGRCYSMSASVLLCLAITSPLPKILWKVILNNMVVQHVFTFAVILKDLDELFCNWLFSAVIHSTALCIWYQFHTFYSQWPFLAQELDFSFPGIWASRWKQISPPTWSLKQKCKRKQTLKLKS